MSLLDQFITELSKPIKEDDVQINMMDRVWFSLQRKNDPKFTIQLWKKHQILYDLWNQVIKSSTKYDPTYLANAYQRFLGFQSFWLARFLDPNETNYKNFIKSSINPLLVPVLMETSGWRCLVREFIPNDYNDSLQTIQIQPFGTFNAFHRSYGEPAMDSTKFKLNGMDLNQMWSTITDQKTVFDTPSLWTDTYAKVPDENGVLKSLNYPNADAFGILKSTNNSFAGALFDGSGSGSKPYYAANIGVLTFLRLCEEGLVNVKTLKEVQEFLIASYWKVHKVLSDMEECGNATVVFYIGCKTTDNKFVTSFLMMWKSLEYQKKIKWIIYS
ncbi:hypothetical protein BC833DRAFT_119453 [Globomyces pollinis-pini]|nr:hypothetical protein BC833DRAFT_119453 [Globomyces pollinis-pini]